MASLQDQMAEYMANGVRLGVLIDRKHRQVYVYRPEQAPEILDNPELVSYEPEMPGFDLEMAKVW